MNLSKKHSKYFSLARKLSKKSDHPQHKLGCILVNGNKIIGLGFNKIRTHSRSTNPWKTCHAEVASVVNAEEEDLFGATAYVYRETRNGSLGLSKPCIYCESLLRSVGIKKVYYTIINGYEEQIYE